MTAVEANFRETLSSVNQICFVQIFSSTQVSEVAARFSLALISTVGKTNANKKIEPVRNLRLV